MFRRKLTGKQPTRSVAPNGRRSRSRPAKRDWTRHVRFEALEDRYLLSAGPTPAGAEFQVNTYTTGSQTYAKVASDSAGDTVVVWQSQGQGGGSYGVYAQRYDVAGAAQGSEFQVNASTNGDPLYPNVAMDSAGDFAIVWADSHGAGSGFDVVAQRYSATGVAQGSEITVVNYSSGSLPALGYPQRPSLAVAMDLSGDFVVSWAGPATSGSGYTIYAQRYSASGAAQGSALQAGANTASYQEPAVAMDAAGDFAVAWESFDSSAGLLFVQRYSANGVTLGSTFAPAQPQNAASADNASIAMDAAGDFVVAWMGFEMGGVYADRYDSSGSLQQGYFQVPASNTIAQNDPSVAMDAAGDFVITWYSFGELGASGPNIYGQLFNASGSPQGSEFLAIAGGGDSAVAMDSTGNFVVVNGSGNVDAQRYRGNMINATGPVVPVGSEFQVNTYTTGNQDQPKVATDAMGDYVVVWQGDSSYFGTGQEGTSYSIYAQRYNAAGAAQGSQFRVNSSTTGDQIAPTVAMDAVGDFVIAWDNDHGAGSGFSIYAQRYNASGVAQGSEFLVAAYSTGSMAPPFPASSPVAAMDSAGDIVITWDTPEQITDVGGLGDVSVLAQRYNASGEAQGPEFQVNDSGLLAFSTSLSAAMDSGGDFVITWAGYHGTSPGFGGIFAQRYNSSGVAQGSNFQVDSLPQSFSPEEPAVAIDSAGDFVIAWSYPIDGGIRAQRYNAAGVAQGSEFQADTFSTTFQGFASVAMDSAGDFVVAWSNNGFDSNHDGVYAQRYNPAGAAEGSEFRINTYTSTLGFQNTPSAAMDSAGDFVIAWQSFDQDGSGYGIYAQRYSISPQQTPSPISQQGTTLTIDASGLVGPFFFEFETATTFDFTYNGTTYFYGTASVSQVIFNGVAGASSEVVFYDNLSTDAYAANQSFSSTTVTRTGGVSFEFDANNVSTFYAYVSDPSSTATVNVADGSGANFFVDAQGNSSDSDYSYIADPIQGIYSELSGFGPETVTGSGGSTYAYVYSTSSANFVGDPGGSTYTVLSLLSILSLRTMPVVNQSALDSGTVDSITLYPTFTTTFDSFSQLYVVGASDGSDSVTLHTQGGSFVGTPSFSSVGGTFNGQPFLIGALYAAHVTAQATNPTDSAFFYSSAGNAFEGTTGSGGSTLTGSAAGFAGFPTFVSQAIGFQSVTVMESGTGTDVANLTSPGNGVFNSTPTVSTLAVDGVTVFTVLTSFTNVITAGGSSTTVFAAVPAVVNFIGASDGSDTANLYDGAGDNDVVAAGSDVTLTRALNSVKASQVGYVLAYQTLGSNDEASVASIDYTLQLIGDWKGA